MVIDNPRPVVDIGARVYNSGNQTLTTGTTLFPAFDTEAYDTDAIHDTVTNNSRLTCKTAGKYIMMATAEISFNANGRRELSIRLNGSTNIAQLRLHPGTTHTVIQIATVYSLAVNDYVEFGVLQDSGVDIVLWGNAISAFIMQRIG